MKTKTILFDDTGILSIDDKTANNVWNIMSEHVRSNEITLVIVEHNVERAKLADRCFELVRNQDSDFSVLLEVDK